MEAERVLRCGKPDCIEQVSAPEKLHYGKLLSEIKKNGWVYRGSPQGHQFRCPSHVWTE